jgi:hypothetical protein
MEMQKAKLRDFSDGAIKVLCATTVKIGFNYKNINKLLIINNNNLN